MKCKVLISEISVDLFVAIGQGFQEGQCPIICWDDELLN